MGDEEEVAPEVTLVDVDADGRPVEPAPVVVRAPRRWPWRVAVAAAVALLLGVGLVARSSSGQTTHPALAPSVAPAEPAVAQAPLALRPGGTVLWAAGQDPVDLTTADGLVAWVDRAVPVSSSAPGELVLGDPATGAAERVAATGPGRSVRGPVLTGGRLAWVEQASSGSGSWDVRWRATTGGPVTTAGSGSGAAPALTAADGVVGWVQDRRAVLLRPDGTRTVVPTADVDDLVVVDRRTVVTAAGGAAGRVVASDVEDGRECLLTVLHDGARGLSADGRRVLVLVGAAPDTQVVLPAVFDLDRPPAESPYLLAVTDGPYPRLGATWTVVTTAGGLEVSPLVGPGTVDLNPSLGGGPAVDGPRLARFSTVSTEPRRIVVELTTVGSVSPPAGATGPSRTR